MRSAKRSPALALALLLLFQFAKSDHLTSGWRSCGQGSFTINDATLAPADIYPGDSVRFTIDATAGEKDVEAGTITMLVRLSGLPIYTEQDNLCEKSTCPIAKESPAKVVYEQNFPEFTPPGSYSVTLSGKSSNGDQLFCVIISFVVKPKESALIDDVTNPLLQSRKLMLS